MRRLLLAALGAGVVLFASGVVASPYVKKAWNEKALPFINDKFPELKKTIKCLNRSAPVVNSNNLSSEYIDFTADKEKLQIFTDRINEALLSNPDRLEKSSNVISAQLGRPLIVDGIFIPIKIDEATKFFNTTKT